MVAGVYIRHRFGGNMDSVEKFTILGCAASNDRTRAREFVQHAELGRWFMPTVEDGLPEKGFIPAEDAVLAWDTLQSDGGIRLACNFTVFFRPQTVFDDLETR